MKEMWLLNEMQTRLLQSVVEEEVFCFFGFFLNVAMKESMARGTWKSPEQEEEVVA